MTVKRLLTAAAVALPFTLASQLSAEEMEIDGRIESVDAQNRTITVELEEAGRTVTYSVPEDTDITVYGNIGSDMSELHSGQGVTLRFDDEEKLNEWVIVHMITVS